VWILIINALLWLHYFNFTARIKIKRKARHRGQTLPELQKAHLTVGSIFLQNMDTAHGVI